MTVFFIFFIKLTDICLNLLVRENLMKYGKDMFKKCFEIVASNFSLNEQFANVIATSYSKQPVKEFGENMQVSIVKHYETYETLWFFSHSSDVKSALSIDKNNGS